MAYRCARREFLRNLGLSAAALPFLGTLPSLAAAAGAARRKRLIIVFSPNGVVPPTFWPKETGNDFTLPETLQPLEPFKKQMLVLRGMSNLVRGDGDNHMRGMSCLLTGVELLPGNIQGGSHTPAGWANGLSIDQEIRNFLQSRDETRTRFGSLELGVTVPDRADPWTRMVYANANKPVVPIDDPYQTFAKLYGQVQDQESLSSVLDAVADDLRAVRAAVGAEDRKLLDEHETLVRQLEQELLAGRNQQGPPPPVLESGVKNTNDHIPKLSRMQIDLLVHGLLTDAARVATLQFTNSVGQARLRWLNIDETHHELSHEPDSNAAAQDKLTRINRWFCGEIAHLVERLQTTPEPSGEGTMLDNTVVVWTNELGKGNSHTLDNIPFVLIGGGLGFRTGRSLDYKRTPHNRLLLALAHGFGHEIDVFGKKELCEGGPLGDLA